MLKEFSLIEKISLAVVALVLATAAISFTVNIEIRSNYNEFTVGSTTLSGHEKFQDLIVGPIFIGAFFITSVLGYFILSECKRVFGNFQSAMLSKHWLLWSLPCIAITVGALRSDVFDSFILSGSATGIVLLTIIWVISSRKLHAINPSAASLAVFSILILSLMPLELALVLGRISAQTLSNLTLKPFLNASFFIFIIGAIALICSAIFVPNYLRKILSFILLLSQLGMCSLFLTMYPARLASPDHYLFHFSTTIGLRIVIAIIITCGFIDIISRFLQHRKSLNVWDLISPIAIFGMIFSLGLGITVAPHISPDDYHIGEGILGVWSYIHGAIPYIDYVPPHGLAVDDFGVAISYLFFDGTAATFMEANRLAIGFLAFASFLSIRKFSGSLPLAAVSIFFIGTLFPTWLFLTPFACLWLSPRLISKPDQWLAIWLITVPIVVLGVPAEGILLVVSSGLIALNVSWNFWNQGSSRQWKNILISIAILVLAALLTPITHMLFAAVRYVVENGPINSIAYGVPWSESWSKQFDLTLELLRMSWLLACSLFLILIASSWCNLRKRKKVLPALFGFIFLGLLIPYMMGRIDAGYLSRPGSGSIFAWTVLVPLALWRFVKPELRPIILFLITIISSSLDFAILSSQAFIQAISPTVATGPLTNVASLGLPHIGVAQIDPEHLDRLLRLNNILRQELKSDETYLDLTSRNAQYFYMGRKPAMTVTAPYNIPLVSQQYREVRRLTQNLPRIALLEGSNIAFDGGGLALRNPLLFRFALKYYEPFFMDGFIIGYRKDGSPKQDLQNQTLAIADLTDTNWDRGFLRSNSGILLRDRALGLALIKVGNKIRFANGEVRKVTKKDPRLGAFFVDGLPLNPDQVGSPHSITILNSSNEIKLALLDLAFARSNLGKVPVSWGRSVGALSKKMTLAEQLDGVNPTLRDLEAQADTLKITGHTPQLTYNLPLPSISGDEAGLLSLDFSCVEQKAQPQLEISWWGDEQPQSYNESEVKFTAENGHLIIPLDSQPRWLTLKETKGLRVSLINSAACSSIAIKNLALYRRNF